MLEIGEDSGRLDMHYQGESAVGNWAINLMLNVLQ